MFEIELSAVGTISDCVCICVCVSVCGGGEGVSAAHGKFRGRGNITNKDLKKNKKKPDTLHSKRPQSLRDLY